MSQFKGYLVVQNSNGSTGNCFTSNDENLIVLQTPVSENSSQLYLFSIGDVITVEEKKYFEFTMNRLSDEWCLQKSEDQMVVSQSFSVFLIPYSDKFNPEDTAFEILDDSSKYKAYSIDDAQVQLIKSDPPKKSKKKWIIKPGTSYVE